MVKGPDPPCQTEACTLQACLSKNTYSQDKCTEHMRNLYKCCQALYDATEDQGISTACPIPSVVRRWLKAHTTSAQ